MDATMTDAQRSSPPSNLHREIDDLETLADWMDSRFRIPGTRIRFGLDALFGLVPGVGDGLLTLPGIYILVRARRMGAPILLVAHMAVNLVVDLLVGAIPLIGDIFDIGFRANRRNVGLLREHFARTAPIGMEMPSPG